MATAANIERLRSFVDEPIETDDWPDIKLGSFIDDAADDLMAAAAEVWAAKASAYASLVNVSESGSSRSLGNLMDNALKMSSYYRGRSAAIVQVVTGGPIIADLVRP